MSEMPTNRLIREILDRRSAAVAGALIVLAALSLFVTVCDNQPKKSMFVMDDFESGALTDWKAVGAGSGGWLIYTDGQKAPDPAQSDPNVQVRGGDRYERSRYAHPVSRCEAGRSLQASPERVLRGGRRFE
jgi:hypothetical protein